MPTTTRHTPGPWTAERFTSPPYAASGTWIYGADETHLASVLTDGEATDADARLIAAAPELLAELRRVLDWLASYPGEGARPAYDRAKTLIARIEG